MANEEVIMRPVNTIQFDKDEDGDLMQLINNYALIFNELVMKRTSPRNAIRNFLSQALPIEIERIRGNGGQLERAS